MKPVWSAMGAMLLVLTQAIAAEPSVIVRLPKDPWGFPDLELKGRLGKTFEFSDCEFVSGLTCTVKLKQGQKLPSRVFVAEIYAGGERGGKEWQLIYPTLVPGEKGKATFLHLEGRPERLVLRGDWRAERQRTY